MERKSEDKKGKVKRMEEGVGIGGRQEKTDIAGR